MDPALEALLHILNQNPSLGGVGRVAFLRARAHADLQQRFGERLQCEQDFKPRADALERAGFQLVRELEGRFSLVMLMPERQKELTLADMARAAQLADEGGTVLVSLPNDWGAKRFEERLASVAGGVRTVSKNKCRVFWTSTSSAWDQDTLAAWREGAVMRRVIDGRFWSRPGLFSWDRIDPGSRLLTEHLPGEISGAVADLGVGWGFLSDFLLRNRPEIETLDIYDADRQALEAAKKNLGLVATRVRIRPHWHDVTQGLGDARYDWIVMNPPFHEMRQADPHIGLRFITAAAQALKLHGQLWLVANKHLPYENLMREAFDHSRALVEAEGYKILTGERPSRMARTEAHDRRAHRTRGGR